jgi:alanyl-tRNA synthetase
MTERLYHNDSYLTEFEATLVEASDGGRRIYLDRTAFYPASGGQPHDTGEVEGSQVFEVVDEEDRIAHVVDPPVGNPAVKCRVDWARRFDHMQQHTGQHLLSAVLAALYRIPTVSFHLGQEFSTIDLGTGALSPGQIAEAERRANEVVSENRAVSVAYEDALAGSQLRKATDRTGTLRIVTIEGLDRSACGGTHVRATGEVGPVLLRKTDKIRGNIRLEFLCGGRAVRRSRVEYEAAAEVGRAFSGSLEEGPVLVAALQKRTKDLEKSVGKLAAELAAYKGRELYAATAVGPDGMRRQRRELASGAIDGELRGLAQCYAAGAKAVFLAVLHQPPAVLLAASSDSGLDAGNVLKDALLACGGRGGGNAGLAQGSVPSAEALAKLVEELANRGV